MEMKKTNSPRRFPIHILLILSLAVIFIVSMTMLKKTLLENAQETGTSLSHTYAMEEQNNIAVYESLLMQGTQYIDTQTLNQTDLSKIEKIIHLYFNNIIEVMGEDNIDPYVVMDGRIIAANPWEGDATYDYTQADWYQNALASNGDVVFTDAYEDVITGKYIVTISKKCAQSDSVLAFDILPNHFHEASHEMDLPQDAAYFLCDNAGTLLYYQAPMDATYDQFQNYANDIQAGLNDSSLLAYDAYIYDLEGQRRGVYYTELDNGWVSIVTIPFSMILEDLNQLTFLFTLIFIIFMSYTLMVTWKDHRISNRFKLTNETLRVLGNTYYALYRINYEEGTYEMIKSSKYVGSRIPTRGPYDLWMNIAIEVIEENASEDYRESFSLANIKRLVEHHVHRYGGDFLRRFGDEYRWVNVSMLYDDSLANNEVVLCFKEVDQEKKEELQQKKLLENTLASARRSEKSKMAFFSNMSHDMRTPLNAIIGLSKLAHQYINDPDKIKEYIDKINVSSRQLLGLINDILEMSRLEQGKVVLDYKSFDLRHLIEESASVFQFQSEQEDKKFEVHFDIVHHQVVGDSFRISQILNNLLSNAFKFTSPKDTISIFVKEYDYQEHAKYQIIVQDTGIGMSEDFIKRIFEPYARETRFTSKSIHGTGLGMPIVRSLVMQMSGQIQVESQLGEGSRFIVTIPLQIDDAIQEVKKTHEISSVDLEGKRVLLAEDNELNMEIATEVLEMQGMIVTQAWNGQEAVEKFKTSQPYSYDFILMDMQMPIMDGCAATKQIRTLEREDARKIPIIAVTANAFAEDIAKTSEAGMDAHVSKPIDFKILYQVLTELL